MFSMLLFGICKRSWMYFSTVVVSIFGVLKYEGFMEKSMQGTKMSFFDQFCPVLSHLFLVFSESSSIKVLVSSEKRGGFPKEYGTRLEEG